MLIVNKKIIIGIIIVVVIGIGAVSFGQMSQNGKSEVTNVKETQRVPQSFTVDLHESVGFKESP
ncbi:MAG: hypothetical protein K8Q89_03550 [Nitrosarchaeum sp.]|nr:hypothetical protein [Nitrosarchaeum sp.]